MELQEPPAPLLALPAELIHQVLTFLPPTTLATLSSTCRLLHDHTLSDQLWQPIVNAELPEPFSNPSPCLTFRELYIAHHPYWFIARHKLWLSDSEPSGKLLISRYDPRRGCIEAYAVVAERGLHTFELWSHDPSVAIHSFNPRVQLDLNQPVLKLNVGSPRAQVNRGHTPDFQGPRYEQNLWDTSGDQHCNRRLSQEILMDCSAPAGLCTTLMLARDHPAIATDAGTAVWPPLRLPAPSRTRNASENGYSGSGHRPSKLSQVSQNAFRVRKWVEFHGRHASGNPSALSAFDRISAALGLTVRAQPDSPAAIFGGGLTVRMGEEIATYGTLLPEAYTPTPSKPWRGIWCGDYSGHGCEFLALLQPDHGAEEPLPSGMSWMQEWLQTGRRGSSSSWSSYASAHDELVGTVAEAPFDEDEEDEWEVDAEAIPGQVLPTWRRQSRSAVMQDDKVVYSGRIEAVKLTGDPNIPRGEYTFVVPELGDQGLVRIAQEEIFRGARVVRSAGHIAGRGFRNGM